MDKSPPLEAQWVFKRQLIILFYDFRCGIHSHFPFCCVWAFSIRRFFNLGRWGRERYNINWNECWIHRLLIKKDTPSDIIPDNYFEEYFKSYGCSCPGLTAYLEDL